MNKSITESYFGAEIEPVNIIDALYGKIYVGLLKNDYIKNDYVFYNEIGNDPMELSSIDIDEFEEILEINKRKERIKIVPHKIP